MIILSFHLFVWQELQVLSFCCNICISDSRAALINQFIDLLSTIKCIYNCFDYRWILDFLSSSLTANCKSMTCGQSMTFEDIILAFGEKLIHIFCHFIDQTTKQSNQNNRQWKGWLVNSPDSRNVCLQHVCLFVSVDNNKTSLTRQKKYSESFSIRTWNVYLRLTEQVSTMADEI